MGDKGNRILILLDKSSRIPEIPETIGYIFELLEYPTNTDKERLVYLIDDLGDFKDILIQFINSSYYNLNRKILDINEAISYLGYKTIRNILIAALTKSLFPERIGRSRVFNREKYWKHCLGTAILSDILAKKTGLYKKSELFPHGLTHDIGMLVLDTSLPMVLDKIYKNACENNLQLVKSEFEILEGLTHANIGSWLCDKWNLPKNVANVTKYHHQPLSPDDFQEEVKLVSIADSFSMKYYEETLGIKSNNLIDRIDNNMWDSFKLDKNEILEIRKDLSLMIDKVYNNLNLGALDIAKFGITGI